MFNYVKSPIMQLHNATAIAHISDSASQTLSEHLLNVSELTGGAWIETAEDRRLTLAHLSPPSRGRGSIAWPATSSPSGNERWSWTGQLRSPVQSYRRFGAARLPPKAPPWQRAELFGLDIEGW